MLLCFSFYLGKHSGRQLSLQPSLGSADLNAVFFGSTSTNAAVTLSKRESGDMTEEGAAGPSTSNTSLTAKTQAPKKHIIQVAPPLTSNIISDIVPSLKGCNVCSALGSFRCCVTRQTRCIIMLLTRVHLFFTLYESSLVLCHFMCIVCIIRF